MRITEKAIKFAMVKHQGQIDDDGLDYFLNHCVPVAGLVMVLKKDSEVIAAAYLHDVLEDTECTYDELVTEFGEKIATLVQELTHEGTNDSHGYYFPRLKNQDAILIKFCDRAQNISRMSSWSQHRQEQYLRQSKFWRTE